MALYRKPGSLEKREGGSCFVEPPRRLINYQGQEHDGPAHPCQFLRQNNHKNHSTGSYLGGPEFETKCGAFCNERVGPGRAGGRPKQCSSATAAVHRPRCRHRLPSNKAGGRSFVNSAPNRELAHAGSLEHNWDRQCTLRRPRTKPRIDLERRRILGTIVAEKNRNIATGKVSHRT